MSTDKKEKNAAAQAESTEEIKDEAKADVKAEEIKSDDAPKTAADEKKHDKKSAKKEKKTEEKKEAEAAEKVLDTAMAALNDKYLRLCAEYDNFRRRSQKEKDSLYGDIKADTLLKFLPVYDNLLRALNTPTEDEAYKKGVEMTMNQFNTTMEKLGVTKIESLGAKFDPAIAKAVKAMTENMTKPMNDFLMPQYSGEGFTPGSTDVGDVSWQTPTAQVIVAAWPAGVPGHSWQIVSCGKTSLTHKALNCAGKVIASAIELINDPALLQKAKDEHAERAAGGYVCPIEKDAVPIAI